MTFVKQVFLSMTRATWFKLASATIILLTFGAHDYFREKAQRDRDAVSAVLVRLHTVMDNDLIADQINDKTSLAIARGENPDNLPLTEQIKLFKGDQRLLEEKRLLCLIYYQTRLVVGHEFDERLLSQNKELTDLESKFSKISDELHGDLDHLPLDAATQNVLYSDLHELHGQLRSILPKTVKTQIGMEERLLKMKAKEDLTLSIWIYTSIWLYILGWVLGAVGIALSDYKPPAIWDGP